MTISQAQVVDITGGKVAGKVGIVWNGSDSAFVRTDDEYVTMSNGSQWTVSIRVRLTPDGWETYKDGTTSIRRKGDNDVFASVPVTFRKAITDAVIAAVTEAHTPEIARAAGLERAQHAYDRADRHVRDLEAQLSEARQVRRGAARTVALFTD